MTKHLKVAPNLSMPPDAATETFGILAVKRAGKSNAAVVIAEEMFAAGIPWVAIDPKGDWWGIRGRGTGPGLSVLVMGGLHGDVPLEPTAGEVVADFIVNQRVTCVLDVSEMTKADQRRFLTSFVSRLYRINREPLHVFCEEADEYIPQRVQADMTKMVGAFETLVKRGGFRGIGVTLITQRSASLNNDVLTQVGTLFAMRTPHKADRDKVKGWVEYHDSGAEVLADIGRLHAGEAWVISPEWLGEVRKIKFRRRKTFDSGATPKVGEKIRPPANLADVNLDAIREAMSATIEKVEQESPAYWKRRATAAEQDNLNLKMSIEQIQASKPEPEKVEIPTLTQDDAERVQALVATMETLISELREEADHLKGGIADTLLAQRKAASSKSSADYLAPALDEKRRKSPTPFIPMPKPQVSKADVYGDSLTGPECKILTALAQHGPKDKITLAILTGYSHKGGGFNNPLGSLRSKGYATKGNPIEATQEGIEALGDYEPLPTGRALLEWWLPQLSGPERKIVAALDENGPMEKVDLAIVTGYSPQGGGFNNPLGHLRTLGIVQRGNPVALNEEMV